MPLAACTTNNAVRKEYNDELMKDLHSRSKKMDITFDGDYMAMLDRM